jgi:hypothetical protein
VSQARQATSLISDWLILAMGMLGIVRKDQEGLERSRERDWFKNWALMSEFCDESALLIRKLAEAGYFLLGFRDVEPAAIGQIADPEIVRPLLDGALGGIGPTEREAHTDLGDFIKEELHDCFAGVFDLAARDCSAQSGSVRLHDRTIGVEAQGVAPCVFGNFTKKNSHTRSLCDFGKWARSGEKSSTCPVCPDAQRRPVGMKEHEWMAMSRFQSISGSDSLALHSLDICEMPGPLVAAQTKREAHPGWPKAKRSIPFFRHTLTHFHPLFSGWHFKSDLIFNTQPNDVAAHLTARENRGLPAR